MAKVTLQTITNLDNPPTAVAQLTYNFEALQTVIDTLLSRDGATPNSMLSNLDMNDYRIVNLPVPISPTEPARHGDIQQYVDQAQDWAEVAEDEADRAELEANDAAASAAEALVTLADLKTRYLGAFPSNPATGYLGIPLVDGTLYFNTTLGLLMVYNVQEVIVLTDNVVMGSENVIVGMWTPLPATDYAGLDDVDVTGLIAGMIMRYNGTEWNPATLSADNVSFTNVSMTATDVEAALEEILTRTSLGVYDIAFYAGGLMDNGEVLFRHVAARPFSVLVGAPSSVASARVAANATTILLMKKNGTQFGTITFAAAGTTGAFSVAGSTSFATGDILSVEAPATADTTMRDTSITIAARR